MAGRLGGWVQTGVAGSVDCRVASDGTAAAASLPQGAADRSGCTCALQPEAAHLLTCSPALPLLPRRHQAAAPSSRSSPRSGASLACTPGGRRQAQVQGQQEGPAAAGPAAGAARAGAAAGAGAAACRRRRGPRSTRGSRAGQRRRRGRSGGSRAAPQVSPAPRACLPFTRRMPCTPHPATSTPWPHPCLTPALPPALPLQAAAG